MFAKENEEIILDPAKCSIERVSGSEVRMSKGSGKKRKEQLARKNYFFWLLHRR